MTRVVISSEIPEEVSDAIDDMIENGQYDNRSEFVREVLTDYLSINGISEEDKISMIIGQASKIHGIAKSMSDEMNEDSE